MKQGKLNRKQYERIRKMDHGQMQEYFRTVYQAGKDAGIAEAIESRETPELIGLEEKLLDVRGIGAAKARYICDIVREHLESAPAEKGQ